MQKFGESAHSPVVKEVFKPEGLYVKRCCHIQDCREYHTTTAQMNHLQLNNSVTSLLALLTGELEYGRRYAALILILVYYTNIPFESLLFSDLNAAKVNFKAITK